MIPNFNDNGLLPPGVHWVETVDEILSRFGHNAHRRSLLGGLTAATALLSSAGCRRLYVDGSFVTSKQYPNDYDACWDTEGVSKDLLDPVFLDFENFRARQKARFRGEFFPARALAESPWKTFWEFFQTDKETGLPKGIIGIQLTDSR